MNNFEFLEALLKLTYETGVTAEGKTIFKSKTYRNVKHLATAASFSAVAQAIATLASYPLVAVHKNETSELVTV